MFRKIFILSLVFVLSLTACAQATPQPVEPEQSKLAVVATTSIVADIVRQVGGELVEVTILLPLGADPHAYDPAPQDIAKISTAQVIFANGAGLEEFLEAVIENAGAADRLVEVSEGIELMHFDDDHDDEKADEDELADEDEHADEDEYGHDQGDPHTWVDPNLVKVWVENIRIKLVELDPGNAETYKANADSYLAELDALDGWVREQVALIPEANRKIVTDHLVFGYFAERYGFEQVGAIIPGYSTMSAPSAQEVAAIQDAIRYLGVKAVFVGDTVNPTIAQRVAEDTGTTLVLLYHGSLSEPGGPAENYLNYIRYNVTAIVEALK
jgi:manganese/iron transport system substrate-binding protein